MVIQLRFAALIGGTAVLIAASEHPIHAARVELVAHRADVAATVRVYLEDFAPGEDLRAISAYFDRTVELTDRSGRRVLLRPTGTAREGERLRISLVGRSVVGLSRGRMQVTILQERFDDQVNVVDARVSRKQQQLVFVTGDGPQELR